MKSLKLLILASFMSLFCAGSYASQAGKIDFADLSGFYGDPKVEVNLTAALMGMVSSFAKHSDPEVGEILAGLESIKVRVYQLNDKADKALSTIEDVSKNLKKDQWETLVTVDEEKERVRIFSKSTNDVIDGVVVMVVSPDKNGGEAVFINIVGEIDPAKISKVTKSLDVDLEQ